jgi:hypothetical protein
MTRLNWLACVGVGLLALVVSMQTVIGDDVANPADGSRPQTAATAANDAGDEAAVLTQPDRVSDTADATEPVELFAGVKKGKLEMKFIARSDRAARLLLTNKTKQPVKVRLPEAFAGVPVDPRAEQRVGAAGDSSIPITFAANHDGGARVFLAADPNRPRTLRLPAAFADAPVLAQRQNFGGGGQFGGGGNTNFGGNQAIGGGFGGGGQFGGGGFGGGGGGFFSVPPEQTARIDVAVVCLNHGLKDPTSSKPYQMVPLDQYVDRPDVIELVKAFGRGELQHGAAQAAAWHLNSGLSWAELAAKQQGTERNANRPPYFSGYELQAGMAYSAEAARRGQLAQLEQQHRGDTTAAADGSDALSTADDGSRFSTTPKAGDSPPKARTTGEKKDTAPGSGE